MKPILRFTNFDNDWEEIELLKIASEISYGMNAASKEYDGENKYIRITDIDEQTNKYTHKNIVSPDGDLEEKFLVKENDILFARTGASTGKTYLYDKNDGKLYYAGFLIKANIINHNANFIFQQTKLNKYNNWVKIMSMRSGQPGINSQEYGSYKFSITSPKEENKVSNFLSLLDKKIELQSKKIEDLKLFKKGLYSCLKKHVSEYKTIKLGNLCNITTGKLDANAMKENGKYRFYTCAEEYYYIDEYAFDTEALLISGNGANVGYIHYYKGKFNAYQRTYVLDKFSENINYIKIFLDNNLKARISSEVRAGNTPYITLPTLSEMKIQIPIRNDDIKQFDSINLINNKIHLNISKLSKLQELKKGLMQNMFV